MSSTASSLKLMNSTNGLSIQIIKWTCLSPRVSNLRFLINSIIVPMIRSRAVHNYRNSDWRSKVKTISYNKSIKFSRKLNKTWKLRKKRFSKFNRSRTRLNPKYSPKVQQSKICKINWVRKKRCIKLKNRIMSNKSKIWTRWCLSNSRTLIFNTKKWMRA